MSAALLDELLADFLAPVRGSHAAPTPAKAAKAANREHPCGPALDPQRCEDLRTPANAQQHETGDRLTSQEFAAVRTVENEPQSEQACGSSQDSQDSQACPRIALDLAAVAWTNADIGRFSDRRARLLRWGWAEPEAEELAERLVKRDREHGERMSCTDCRYYRPGRCGAHSTAGLQSPEVGRDLAEMLQRCPGFMAAHAGDPTARGER